MVETHQLGGAFGGDAELGPEAGPQALAAPADLVRRPVDPNLPSAGEHLPPGVGDLGVDRRAASSRRPRTSSAIANRSSHEAAARSLSWVRAASRPQRSSRAATVPLSSAEAPSNACRHDRRQPDLQALDVPAACPDTAGSKSDDDTAALLPAVSRRRRAALRRGR